MESKTVFEGFFNVRRDWVKGHSYDVIEMPNNSVSVIVETTPKTLLLQWEFRHPMQKRLLSTVGGLIDKDETPLQAAERELLEETGYRAKNFQILGEHYPFPGITAQKLYVVLATDAYLAKPQKLDALEDIQTDLIEYGSLPQMISTASVDGVLLASLQLYQWHLINRSV